MARQTASPVDGWAQLWHLTREKVISFVLVLLKENGQFRYMKQYMHCHIVTSHCKSRGKSTRHLRSSHFTMLREEEFHLTENFGNASVHRAT